MKAVAMMLSAVVLMGGSAVAQASAELAKTKACLACHSVDTKLVGPAYREVAAKYATQADAEAYLAGKIRQGGTGVWGQVPMPPNAHVSENEAKALAAWIMSHK